MKLRTLSLTLFLATRVFATEPNTLSSEEKATGWRLLFDGKTLAGWRSLKSEQPPTGWAARDGALTRTAKSGDLVSVEEFADFELSAQWKIVRGVNSGILYRVGLGETRTIATGPEYQILDNGLFDELLAKGVAVGPLNRTGAIYDLVAPGRDVANPVGEWNETRIVVRDWRVEHWLNGVKLAEADLASPAGKALIAASKFAATPKFATLARGHIALQDHDERVSFRNIKIRELK
jgi:hypothetical protein